MSVKGLCTNKQCRVILTEENCSPAHLKRGYGYCRPCFRVWNNDYIRRNHNHVRSTRKLWRVANLDKIKVQNRHARYGVSGDEFDSKLRSQEGKCKICNRLLIRPHQDHDHVTGECRDILCGPCNWILGHCGENIRVLENAILYLRRWQDESQLSEASVSNNRD